MARILSFLDTPAGRGLRYAVSLGLLAMVAARIDWTALVARRDFIDGPVVLAALALTAASYPLHAWRWWRLLALFGVRRPLGWCHRVTWIGQFYNGLLPGGIGGDSVRVYRLLRDAPGRRAEGLAATAADRVAGLAALLALAAAAVAMVPGADAPGLRALAPAIWTGLAAAVAGGLLLFWLPVAALPAGLRRRAGADRIQRLDAARSRLRAAPGAVAAIGAASLALWLFDFVAVAWLAHAVGLPVSFGEVCLAAAVAYAATVLPISVGGHGVREGALLGVLALLGRVPEAGPIREAALLLALLVWVVNVACSLLGGLWLLRPERS